MIVAGALALLLSAAFVGVTLLQVRLKKVDGGLALCLHLAAAVMGEICLLATVADLRFWWFVPLWSSLFGTLLCLRTWLLQAAIRHGEERRRRRRIGHHEPVLTPAQREASRRQLGRYLLEVAAVSLALGGLWLWLRGQSG